VYRRRSGECFEGKRLAGVARGIGRANCLERRVATANFAANNAAVARLTSNRPLRIQRRGESRFRERFPVRADRPDGRGQKAEGISSPFTRGVKVTAMHLPHYPMRWSIARASRASRAACACTCMCAVYTFGRYRAIIYRTRPRYSAFLNVLPRAGGYFGPITGYVTVRSAIRSQ